MATDKIRKYVLPNIPYLFIGWFCLKIGTAYRLAAGAGFGEKLLGLGQTIGAAFGSFAPGLAPLDWFVGIVGAVGFLWGDRIFEKCGIRRDEGGDGGKTLEIRGKRRLSARDGGANYQQS